MRTVKVENGERALARFQATHPDLVVLDIIMPELNGAEVCKTLRHVSTVPIVFLAWGKPTTPCCTWRKKA